jgi:hypothetical protein
MKSLSLLLGVAAVGCATTGPYSWQPPHANQHALADKYPRAVAVLLTRDDRVVLTFDGSAPPTQQMRHDVIAILAKGGQGWADVAIPVGTDRLDFLRARTVDPDGRIEEVRPEEVHTGVAHTGNRVTGTDASIKVFRLPRVRVGSIIEYAYSVSSDQRIIEARRGMSAEIPIAHYHAEISAVGPAELGVRVHGEPRPNIDNEPHRVTIDARDIPAVQREPFSPSPWLTDAYWIVSLRMLLLHRMVVTGLDTWAHALAPLSHTLYDAPQVKAFAAAAALKPKLADCTTRRCAAGRALMLVDEKTALSSFGFGRRFRPADEILASHVANCAEKALLLYGALTAAGVRSSFVFVSRDDTLVPEAPSLQGLDHLLVRVDRQADVDEPIYVDPSCEACALGQLPPWSNDRLAIVVGRYRGLSVEPETPVEIVHLEAPTPLASVHRVLIDATLASNGSFSGRIQQEYDGQPGVDLRIRTRGWGDEQWRREIESNLHERAATSALRKRTPVSWEKLDARLRYSADVDVPAYVSADGAREIVPLSFLRMSWDRDFGDEPRVHDISVHDGEREDETIVFHLPSGWTATDLPRTGVWHSAAVDGAIDVKSAPGTVTIRRVVQTHAGRWPPGEMQNIATVVGHIAGLRQAAFAVAPPRSGSP